MKLRELNEMVEKSNVKAKIQIVDGKTNIGSPFTVTVEKSIDSIDDEVAAPGDDVTKYKFTSGAISQINKVAAANGVKADISNDYLENGVSGIIEVETE